MMATLRNFDRVSLLGDHIKLMGIDPVGMNSADPDQIGSIELSCLLYDATHLLRRFLHRIPSFDIGSDSLRNALPFIESEVASGIGHPVSPLQAPRGIP